MPWLPTFLYQAHHTGTPWAKPADFAAMVNAVTSFAGGATNQGRALALVYFALVGLGLFGVARGSFHVDLDLRTRPRGRGLALVLTGTLAAAVVGGYASRSAFQARYASVVFVPLVLLVALGPRHLRRWPHQGWGPDRHGRVRPRQRPSECLDEPDPGGPGGGHARSAGSSR